MTRARNVVTSPIQGLRVGMFKRALVDGASKQDVQAAAFGSRERTLDFAPVGAQTRGLKIIIAFWNAQPVTSRTIPSAPAHAGNDALGQIDVALGNRDVTVQPQQRFAI
jgi:hypothetical protein